MSQLATIFEKIKEDFFDHHQAEVEGENYKLIFSPFSTGFTYDDFLFLNSETASENARKYLDELLEFSQIANTIPREEHFWAVSDDQDYLYIPYRNILADLKLLDPDSLEPEILYDHPIFFRALKTLDEELQSAYRPFLDLQAKLESEIKQLQENLSESNRSAVELEIKMKRDNLTELREKWSSEGKKAEAEAEIIEIIKDEFKRFMRRFVEVKGQLETAIRSHAGSGSSFLLTSCMPNNLYSGENLEWRRIRLDHVEIRRILKDLDPDSYTSIMGSADAADLEVESISFELIFVQVTRPWFDDAILRSPFWNINVLDRSEIHIPRYTNKLIFIRKVDVKLPENSKVNDRILKKNVLQSLGPFILNTAQFSSGNRLQLNSVNKSLQLNRKALFNVGSKLGRQPEAPQRKALIAKKQKQFLKVAPRLQSIAMRGRPKIKAPTPVMASFQPVMMTVQPAIIKPAVQDRVRCRFLFVDSTNREKVSTQSVDAEIRPAGSRSAVPETFKHPDSHVLEIDLIRGRKYEIDIRAVGYLQRNVAFQPVKTNPPQPFELTVRLEPDPRQDSSKEAFQLIGVISKEIEAFPNPIKGADYI